MQNVLSQKSLYQHSYSSLSVKDKRRHVEHEIVAVDSNGKSTDFASDGDEPDDHRLVLQKNLCVDCDAIQFGLESPLYKSGRFMPVDDDYPCGRQLGNAIHEVFETVGFTKARAEFETFMYDTEVHLLIEQVFNKYGLMVNRHPNWFVTTARIVWHTLNARLPLMNLMNSVQKNNSFALCDLEDEDHYPEVEFMLEGEFRHGAELLKNGEYFSKGFIDLMFVREVGGIKRYYILDWKSDRLADEDYANPQALRAKVDEEYAVQRVLYTYCLIEWLRQFNPDKSREQIFKDHFGGIYYAYVRGCQADTCSGIYARTWTSWQELENAFKKIMGAVNESR